MKKLIALMLSLTLLLTCTGTINADSSTKGIHGWMVYEILDGYRYEDTDTHTVYCPHHEQYDTCVKRTKYINVKLQCYKCEITRDFPGERRRVLEHSHPDCTIEKTIYPLDWSPHSPYAPQPVDNGTVITD